MKSQILTGNKDVDISILNLLNDHELTQVCKVNKAAEHLCDLEELWRIRFFNKFGEYLGPLQDIDRKEKNWKEFYTDFVREVNRFDRYFTTLSNGEKFYDLRDMKEFYSNDWENTDTDDKKVRIMRRNGTYVPAMYDFFTDLLGNPNIVKYYFQLAKRNPEYEFLKKDIYDLHMMMNYVFERMKYDPEALQNVNENINLVNRSFF